MSNLSDYTYPNGVNTAFQYDSLNRLTSLASNANGAAVASYAYSLGSAGNRTSVTELSGRKVSYGYDNLYRLASETIANDLSGVNGAVSYQYDAVGNRKQLNSGLSGIVPGLWNYDANDRLTGFGADTYAGAGNIVWRAGIQNTYDFENHLVQHGGISYVYDGDGNRVAKTLGGVTTSYLVDTLNPTGYAQVLDELQSGAVNRSYTYGLELVSESQPSATAQPPLNTWTTSWYGYDGHGSVRYLTDSTGAVTDTYDFDAFGNLINSTGTTPNNYLFAGEQFDPDLGLYYNRARYLDVRAGRFWGMDTEEGQDQDPLSLHKYLYADADPVDGVDPTGHDDMSDTLDALTMTIMSTAIIGPAACAGCGAQVPTDSDAALLARLVFAEAIPTQTGTLAVASVAVNRMHSNSHGFPGSISGVIYQSGQFEATFQPKPGQKQNMKWLKAATQAGIHGLNPNDCLTYQLAVSAAQNAMSGNTNTDAVLYYDDRISEPKWVNDLLLPADVIGGDSPSNYIDYPAGNGQYFFKYAPPKPKPHRPGRN